MRQLHLNLSIVLLGIAGAVNAQQLPYYTQFRNYQSLINPASVNSEFFLYEYNVSVQANYRAQWIAQEETPRTMQFSGEYISDFGGAFELIAGAALLQDRTGPQSLTGTYARIGSIFAKDPYQGAFSIGFSFGAVQYRVSADRLVWKDPDDPNIPENNISVSRPDIGVGLFYYRRLKNGLFTEDNIYFGLSVPQILGTEPIVQTPDNTVSLSRVPHFFGTAGWYHFINEDAFFEVSGWLKYVDGAPLNLDLMGRFQPTRTFWVGGGFNLNGIVHLEAGLNVPGFVLNDANLRIGYAFDYNISAFNIPFGTSHEITLAYMFDTYRRR
jgi:type IX secretion system PorP/SprF family membrane protein